MKRFLVVATLIGLVCSNKLSDQCDKCDSNIVQNDGSIIFKSKQNVSKVANNVTASVKNVHYMPVVGDGNVTMDTNEEAALLRKLSHKLTSISATPFDPAYSSTTSSKCKIHSQMFLEALQNLDLWAVQMHNSTAKISSGLLNGNVNYFGDFDQCLQIQGPVDDLKGKYCLTYLQASIPKNMPKLQQLYKLMHSHSAFISEFDDVTTSSSFF